MEWNRWLCRRSGSRLEEPLCLFKTPSVGVYLVGNEVGQAGEMKGAGTSVTCLTATLSELRCVKCSKSFAERITSGCACRVWRSTQAGLELAVV